MTAKVPRVAMRQRAENVLVSTLGSLGQKNSSAKNARHLKSRNKMNRVDLLMLNYTASAAKVVVKTWFLQQ